MSTDRGLSMARRYLLGQAGEEESAALERQYLGDEAAMDRIAAVEEDLIEDYLAVRLTAEERRHFEKHYLASPHHRTRVETIRQLKAAAGRVAGPRWFRPLALAAAVVLVAAGAAWILRPARDARQTGAQGPTTTPTVAPDRPADALPSPARVFALSISPVSVRSADESPSLVIPPQTDVIVLRLEGETTDKHLDHARAVVRTVAGEEVWQGPATIAGDLPAGVVARVDVPAAQLRVDDYVVVLFGSDAAGVEQERYRYFLRVRAR